MSCRKSLFVKPQAARSLRAGVVAAACWMLPLTTFAQEAEPPTQEPAAASDGAAPYETIPVAGSPLPQESPPATTKPAERALEDVSISATKRERNVRDVPLSIDAFSAEQLRSVGATDLQSIARFTPGVTVSPGMTGESNTVIFRGVSTDTQASFATRTFGLLYDDVSLVNPTVPGGQPNLDPFDMAAVEVLKGPQGTLFGGSALAGAVRYSPARADYEDAYGVFTGGVGNLSRSGDQSRNLAGMWNQPIGERFALRVVASSRDTAGFVDDLRRNHKDTNSSTAEQYRVMLGWKPLDDLEVRLSGLHRDYHLNDGTFADNTERPTNSSRYVDELVDSKTSVGVLTVDWAFEPFNVVLVGSYLDKDFDQVLDISTFLGSANAGQGAFAELPGESTQPSGELRIVSSRPTEFGWAILDRWEYVAGFAYTESDQQFALDIGTQSGGSAILQEVDAQAEEQALFFDLTRKLGDSFELGLGGRLFRHTTDAVSDSTLAAGASALAGTALAGVLPAVPLNHIEGRLKEEEFNPRASLTWRVARDFALFTSAAKGFRFGGINTNPTMDPNVPDFFQSDEIWNYELGARSRWFGGLLQADLTVFYLDWDNVQIQQREFTGSLSYTDNLGGAKSQGVELATQTLLPWGFSLNLNGAYVNAETTEAFQDFQGPAPKGRELPGTPRYNGSARLNYGNLFGPAELNASVSYTYQTENFNNLGQTFEHPSLGLLGANIGLRMGNWIGAPELSLVGTNLTNELEPVLVTDTAMRDAVLVVFNQPRALALNLRASF